VAVVALLHGHFGCEVVIGPGSVLLQSACLTEILQATTAPRVLGEPLRRQKLMTSGALVQVVCRLTRNLERHSGTRVANSMHRFGCLSASHREITERLAGSDLAWLCRWAPGHRMDVLAGVNEGLGLAAWSVHLAWVT